MERPAWAPSDVDLERASVARMYDYFLGGAHNFAVDRALAEEVAAMSPSVPLTMRANRAFVHRAVRHLVEAGIRQFLDIGSGIPTVGNVHEIAQEVDPDSRVFYVDIDRVAVSHSQAILADNDHADVMRADVREPNVILADRRLRALIDLSQPVAVLLAGVMHFVPDSDRPTAISARYVEALAPGSYLALTHATADGQSTDFVEAQKLSTRTSTELRLRSRNEVIAHFTGLELVEPGLVFMPLWRPDPAEPDELHNDPRYCGGYAGVARKPD